MRGTPLERFTAKYYIDTQSSCWIWTASTDEFGYGMFSLDGKNVKAHRAHWMLVIGEIPPGRCILHNCPTGDNPSCVNLFHLRIGTQEENIEDRDKKGRHGNWKLTHCPQGHPYDEANTRREDKGYQGHRYCRTCERDKARRQHAEKGCTPLPGLSPLSRRGVYCKRGHEMTPENTHHHGPTAKSPNGFDECWTCVRARNQRGSDARAERKKALMRPQEESDPS